MKLRMNFWLSNILYTRPTEKLYEIYSTNNPHDAIQEIKAIQEINEKMYNKLKEQIIKKQKTSNEDLKKDDVLIIYSENDKEFIIAKIMEVYNNNSIRINPFKPLLKRNKNLEPHEGFYIYLNINNGFKYLFLFNDGLNGVDMGIRNTINSDPDASRDAAAVVADLADGDHEIDIKINPLRYT